MAVVVARMIAKLSAETAEFHGRMTAAERQVNRFVGATGGANRGLALMRGGFQQLAFQATGVAGPVGKVASGLLTMGVGGPVTLAVLAGIGAIGLAYKTLTQSTKDAEEAQKDLIKSLMSAGAHAQLTAARIQLGQARAALGKTDVSEKGVLGRIADVFRSEGQRETERQKALRAISAAEIEVAAATREAAKWQEKVVEKLREDLALRERLRTLMAGVEGPLPLTMRFPRPAPLLPGAVRLRGITDPRLIPEQRQVVSSQGGPGSELDRFKMTPEFAVMSAMALLQGAQGGAAGLFGAAAGPVAMINPLAGAITAGVGGIFSLFDNSEERRHKALLDKLDQLGQEVGLERVTVVFTGPDGHQVRKSLAELEESDAVERVPGPVGAGG